MALLAWAGSAEAIPITTATGNGADAYVVAGTPGTNFGSASDLHVSRQIGGDNQMTYLRFDLSSVTSPILGAELVLTFAGPSFGSVNFFGLDDANAGNNWNEATISWDTAPAISGVTLDSAAVTPLGGFAVGVSPVTGTLSTAELLSFLNADTDGLVTIALLTTLSLNSGSVFAAKESATLAAPTLNLTVDDTSTLTVPEPTSLVLFAIGLIGLAEGSSRRRKAA